MVLLLALLGCGLDFGNASVITDVQIIATVIEPPEILLGESVGLTVTVADPQQRDLEVMAWLCLPVEGSCLESLLPARSWARVTDVLDEDATFMFRGLSTIELDTDAESVRTSVNTLVCERGACPIMDRVRASGLEPDADLGRLLADPEAILRELPFDGTHLAVKTLPVLLQEPRDRNWNPRIVPKFTGFPTFEPSEAIDLEFKITDANGDPATGFAYTTVGEFDAPKVAVSQSELAMRWISPDDRSIDGRIYIVVEDDRGGTALWRASATLE